MASKDKQSGLSVRERGRKILEKIEASYQSEKRFYETAQRAEEIFANEPKGAYGIDLGWSDSLDFNILFSNVETIVPAIINSPPSPDIRRRFNDTDPVAKDVAEILERSMRCQIDDSRLQTEMERMAQDGFLGGRGLIRLRYKSEETEKEDAEIAEKVRDDESGEPSGDGDVASESQDGYGSDDSDTGVTGERICFEAVSWRDFRRGPAKRWEDVPWIAFRHSIPKDDMETFADQVLYQSQELSEDKLNEPSETDNLVWEYWDRKAKKVCFVEDRTGKIIKEVDDPLGLKRFFPICDPIQPIEINGRLMPVTPFAIYEKLAYEVDIISMRIRFLVKAMKVKALYGGDAVSLNAIVEGEDADLIPIAEPEMWSQNGGLDNMLSWWPVERFAVAVRELYNARKEAKDAIYEITGISDIVRGASMASETATAQQIKSQWGSLRIQKMQRMMERAARDIFVMMAEIIPSKFSAKTLQDMTGIQLIPTEQELKPLPPPMPTGNPEQDQQAGQQYQQAEKARTDKIAKMEAINALLGEKLQQYYRIDVESDSTVRADLTRQKQEVAEFLQGASAYFAAVGPLVQQGALPADLAMEVFAANSRMFNLGKAVEDAIDKATEMAKERAGQPQQPSPEAQAAQAEAQAKTQAAQLDGQIKTQEAQLKAQLMQTDMQERAARLQMEQQQVQSQQMMAREELQAKIALMQQEAQAKRGVEQVKTQSDAIASQADLALKQADLELKALDMQIKMKDLELKQKQIDAPAPKPGVSK